jgi:hypothetical protein
MIKKKKHSKVSQKTLKIDYVQNNLKIHKIDMPKTLIKIPLGPAILQNY